MEKVKFAIEKEDPLEICPVYEWMTLKNDDKRFATVGYVSLDSLQKNNKVYQAINTIIPLDQIDKNDVSFGIETRKEIQLNVMTRRRYKWDIYCEKLYYRDPMTFFHELAKIRPYFYSMDQMSKFSEYQSEHSHSNWKESPWLHEDNHSGQFHLHMNGLMPNQVKPYLYAFQAAIIIYYLAIVILFCMHTSLQPQISDSHRVLFCQKLKFGLIWFPVMLIISVL